MGATIIQRDKETRSDGVLIEMVVWAVDPSVAGSAHGYKYRLYAGRDGKTLVRYDNEAGKGDHKHLGEGKIESPYLFVTMDQALCDFLADVARLTKGVIMANLAIIGISNWTAMQERMHRLAKRLDAGERLPEGDYHLGFADAAQLLAELPPRRLDTLRAIKRSGPASIYAIAKTLGRNYSNVHADVQKLIEHALVEKDNAGRVFVPWGDVVVRVDASLLEAA